MAKGSDNPPNKRPSSRNAKPYDVNNSFVKKMATKVTDFIPQRSWISKWFNTSQNEDTLDNREHSEDPEVEEDIQQPPPSKRPRIRMDVIHPPGTFSIQPRVKTALNTFESSKKQYPLHSEMSEDFLEPATAGPSDIGCLISSSPAMQADIGTVTSHRSDLNSLASSTNNGTTNGIDDNSESSESTSGCSSLIPQVNRHEGPSSSFNSSFSTRKRFIDEKLTFTNHLQHPRSLFIDTTRDTLSSRRPSFNASVMTSTLDRASPLSSPFYSGNTTFGGANAAGLYKRSRNIFNNSSELQLKVPRRTNVEVKPSNETGVDSSGMSQTAKKILEALEHFSSPISDAKKIPLKNTSTLSNRKKARGEAATPSPRIGLRHLTRELNVPTVPDILKLRRRQRLQDTTIAARRIVSAQNDLPPPSQEYHLRTEDGNNEKYQWKLKAKSKVNLEEEETIEPVNLPNIPLPISTLPNFNFTLPPAPAHIVDKTATSKKDTFTFASPIKVTDAGKSLKSINNFTFSNPINAEDKANNITHSELFSKGINVESTTSFTDCATSSMSNFIWSGSSTAPRLKEKAKCSKDDFTSSIQMACELKTGSVMDILSPKSNKTESDLIGQSNSGSTKKRAVIDKISFVTNLDVENTQNIAESSSSISNFLKSPSDWECSECLIRNSDSVKQCSACKAFRSNSDNKALLPSSMTNTIIKSKPVADDCFGSQFKLSANQWQCEACYVRNKQSDTKCAACSTLKPGSASTTQTLILDSVKSQNFDLMDKFKPAEGSWECPGCLLRNNATVITCPCCSASKSISIHVSSKEIDSSESVSQKSSTEGTLSQQIPLIDTEIMNKFKPNKDSWECSGCLVRNNDSVIMCPCCGTAKPGAVENSSKIEPTSTTNGFGDKFKKPEGAWNCDSCLVQNDSKHTKCIACQALKPGAVKLNEPTSNSGSTLQFKFGVPSNTGGFQFGIDKADKSKSDSVSPLNGFKFGNVQQSNETTQFTFGIPRKENINVTEKSNTDSIATSSNGSKLQSSMKKSEKPDTKLDQENKQSIPFNVSKSESSATNEKHTSIMSSNISAPSFTFGIQKSELNQPTLNKETQNTSFATTVAETFKPVTTIVDSTSTSIYTTLPSSLTENNTLNTKSTPIFSFGVSNNTNIVSDTSSSTTTKCLPSFTLPLAFVDSKTTNKTESLPTFSELIKTKSTTLAANISFGESKVAETSAPQLNKPDVPISDTSTASIFPVISSSISLFDNKETKTTIAFGASNIAFAATNNKPSAFAMSENKIPAFGSTETKPSLFGAPETKLPAFGNEEKSTPIFNSSSQQTLTTNPLPAFGTATATPSLFESSATPVFGNNAPSSFGTATTSALFSSTTANETNVSNPTSLFTFGSTAPQTTVQQPAGDGFNFSANPNPAPAAEKSLFMFGSNSNTPQSNNMFGATFTNPVSTNTANFTFNTPKQDTSAFGQNTVTTPMFGSTPQVNPQNQATASFSSTPSSSTGFNFGSTAPPAAPAEGFNFGGVSSTSTSTGGFNFNPATSTSTITFDPNTRPSFNFTKGSVPTEFNAPPQSTKTTTRKIKKAFRRCMR